MPLPLNRESLNKGLSERYATQHVGGAFDAKKATPDIFGQLEKDWTKTGFAKRGDEGLGLEYGAKGQSIYLDGFNNKPYKR